LSRRSRVTYWARPECKAWPRSPNCSAGSRTMLSPKSAMRTQYSLCRISISTKCRAAKPLPPVTTHHLSSAAMVKQKAHQIRIADPQLHTTVWGSNKEVKACLSPTWKKRTQHKLGLRLGRARMGLAQTKHIFQSLPA